MLIYCHNRLVVIVPSSIWLEKLHFRMLILLTVACCLALFIVDMSMEVQTAYYHQSTMGDVTGGLNERTRAYMENQIINLESTSFMYRLMFADETLQMVCLYRVK